MDARVGYVLGRHSKTKVLYGIHRNQKTYLHFQSFHSKWLALTSKEFKDATSNNFTSKTRKSLEGDDEQIYIFGTNQWMGKLDRKV